jgi:arylsulfatase B
MTGRNGSRFGYEHNLHTPEHLDDRFAGMPLDEPLLSNRLQTLGYRTGLVGKWHLGEKLPGHHPNQRGFDHFFGMLGGGHHYWPGRKKHKLQRNGVAAGQPPTPYLTDWFTLEALNFITTAPEGAKAKPWFLYLSYNTPHAPMQAKEEDIEKFAHIKQKTRRIYCAMQHCMDENIGKIIKQLEESKQLKNTLIVFISDNGGSVEVSHALNAPLRGTKGTFLEGGIRVPTIYHWPARLKPTVYVKPVSALDIMATLLTAAGGAPPPTDPKQPKRRRQKRVPIYDSIDLVPYFSGEKTAPPHKRLFWRMALRGFAIREGDWKLLRPNSQPSQLYNLRDDISETNNLIGKHPEIAANLLKTFNAWETTLERNPMFISAPYWSGYNRRLYERTYQLTQPSVNQK